ncbi:hypothetical protein BYT27DRAFT_7182968 [Phlegmacium glaucopus]|nr:hypothetical protein BYT27DRAFT_7182968 [Phlegmacium glaucopus]
MDYKPRYAQPFTLAEATALDVSVISEEISRLQNSLKYLRETQEVLKAALAETSTEPPDSEIAKAFEENQVVIGSQEERISILKMAMTEKGIISASHYDPQQATPLSQSSIIPSNPSHTTTSSPLVDTALSDVEEDGVYL